MKRPKVLIVEDDVWLSEQHARVLKLANYETRQSTNALDAIAKVNDFKPDVIVVDILLTGVTVFAFLHELQSYVDTGKIPIIICSNIASEFRLQDLSVYGVRRILDKVTMVPDDLVVAVRSVLHEYR